ncbi:UvrD-helicase domain-containing protein [Olivibacter ginsenosidimutans]|uniref:DNA 3'-5' helicase n=1 Tax=Olivibacter ginsenosidimutans TaxID=1176537 RepID=A0ABP9C248_9SPHI
MFSVPPVKIVKASAGSGKTFSLTAHYIALLFKGNTSFSQVLALTFTNKATAEMKHRILSVLENLALDKDTHHAYKDLILSLYPNLNAAEISLRARQIYRQILHHYSLFSVTTIDGFVQKIIRSFSYELEIGSSYRLEMNLDKVKKDLSVRLNKVLNDRPDLLQWIIRYAREQIEQGKTWNYTHTLLELANELFKERYQPFHDAIKALKEEDRLTVFETIDELNKEEIKSFETTLKSLLSTAKSIYDAHPVDVTDFNGKSRNFIPKLADLQEIDDPVAVYQKLLPYIDAPEKWQKSMSPPMQVLYDALNAHLKKVKEYYETQAPPYFLALALKENIYYLNLLQEMSSLLRDYREENGVMLISESQSLLREINKTGTANTSFIWEKVGTHFKHLLFDEFQDTSSSQWSNFVPLLTNMLAESAPDEPLAQHLIVGDIKQSIYRWRSGDWTLLDRQVARDLGEHHIQEYSLQENYRSLDNIIDFNNFLYQYAPQWLQEELNDKVRKGIGDEAYEDWWLRHGYDQQLINAYQTSFQQKPVHKSDTNRGGQVTVNVLPLEKGNRSSRQKQTKELALHQMGDTVLQWLSTGKYLPGQIGILVRTNQEAQDVIEHLLSIQQGLATDQRFNVISGEALLLANNRAVKLVISSLRAMMTATNDAAIYKATCLYLFHQKEEEPFLLDPKIWFDLANKPAIADWGNTLPKVIREQWESMQLRPLSELVELLIQGYGLTNNTSDIPYLLAFKDLIERFSALGEQGIPAFLNYWEEEGVKKALPAGEGSNAIEILTIHKSKGLAFDVVMIPFCSWNLDATHLRDFWVNTADTPYEILQAVPVKYNAHKIGKSFLYKAYYEEMLFNYLDALNMLYVATTRTIKELYITLPDANQTPTLIADVLLQVLQRFHGDLQIPYEDGIRFPAHETPFQQQRHSTVEKSEKNKLRIGKVNAHSWVWSLTQYPVSGHLNQALDSQKIKTELLLLGEEDPNIRLGLILHEALSKLNDPTAITRCLSQLQAEGLIKAEEIHSLTERLQRIFDNPELKLFFSDRYQPLSEKSIITAQGKILRPDKVFLGATETLILDFKFTGKKNDELINKDHLLQVKEYRQLLLEMGYPQVRGYVYYAFFDKLIAVQ